MIRNYMHIFAIKQPDTCNNYCTNTYDRVSIKSNGSPTQIDNTGAARTIIGRGGANIHICAFCLINFFEIDCFYSL